MIIVEGPDNSGKTTLIKFLSKHLQFYHYAQGNPPTDQQSILVRARDLVYIYGPTRTICDRVPFISEKVYGPVLRDMDMLEGTTFLTAAIAKGVPVIYCRPSLNYAEGTHRIGEDPRHVKQTIWHKQALINKYDEVMIDIPHIKYDFTTVDHTYGLLLVEYIRLYWKSIGV